jgi:hypothetical protein
MEFDLPLYAVQRLADGSWLVRTQMGDPLLPAVDVVVVVGEQTDIRRDPQSAAAEAEPKYRLQLHSIRRKRRTGNHARDRSCFAQYRNNGFAAHRR